MSAFLPIPSGEPVPHDFEIARDPVTNAEYAQWLRTLTVDEGRRRYCKLMETHFFGGIRSDYSCKPGFERKPVVFVSWYDATAYAQAYACRLPTEDEWQKAAAWLPQEGRMAQWCTGGDQTPTQREAIFYDDENGWALPSPHLADVDWYRPSGAYGCRGMAGNVAEWIDAEMPNGWKKAVGGSLFRPYDLMRIGTFEGDHPSKRLSTFGFRLVREVSA